MISCFSEAVNLMYFLNFTDCPTCSSFFLRCRIAVPDRQLFPSISDSPCAVQLLHRSLPPVLYHRTIVSCLLLQTLCSICRIVLPGWNTSCIILQRTFLHAMLP